MHLSKMNLKILIYTLNIQFKNVLWKLNICRYLIITKKVKNNI